jgi:hypothetical protein
VGIPLLLAAESTPSEVAQALPLQLWVLVGCAAFGALALLLLWITSARYLAASRLILRELRNTTAEIRRWGEIAQRQTELANAPLLKVSKVEEFSSDQGRGTRIEVKNVGFGSAVNVKCTLTDHNDKEYSPPQTEIVGNETAMFEPPLLIESIKNARLEYLSQGGSYAHTTHYVFKSGAQSYALHRVR